LKLSPAEIFHQKGCFYPEKGILYRMNIAKDKVVSIDYTLKDDKDNFIDSTEGSDPLDYLHGYENIIPGLEKALEGKAEGDRVKVAIAAAEAYGERDDRLTASVPRDHFEGVDELEEGMQFQTETSDGPRLITVTKVEGDTVTIDGNHPLAGMNLNFDVTVTGIREASEEELTHGHVHSHAHEDCDGCGACGDDGCGGY
jgi:FKBP-type peptidyl-prolyl cis-trans isomerase SlyD